MQGSIPTSYVVTSGIQMFWRWSSYECCDFCTAITLCTRITPVLHQSSTVSVEYLSKLISNWLGNHEFDFQDSERVHTSYMNYSRHLSITNCPFEISCFFRFRETRVKIIMGLGSDPKITKKNCLKFGYYDIKAQCSPIMKVIRPKRRAWPGF